MNQEFFVMLYLSQLLITIRSSLFLNEFSRFIFTDIAKLKFKVSNYVNIVVLKLLAGSDRILIYHEFEILIMRFYEKKKKKGERETFTKKSLTFLDYCYIK